jgi:hypothetical protein
VIVLQNMAFHHSSNDFQWKTMIFYKILIFLKKYMIAGPGFFEKGWHIAKTC